MGKLCIRETKITRLGDADMVSLLAKDIEFYLNDVAGVNCPPECKNFVSPGTGGEAFGCSLSVCTPMDCLEANIVDMARWLVAKGWVPTSSRKK